MSKTAAQLTSIIIKGLATSMGARVVAMALRFIVIGLLPLWLLPSEIGYAALLMIFVNLPIAFADLGLGTALIKDATFEKPLIHSAFTLSLGTSMLMAIGLILLAPAIQANFGLPAFFLVVASFAIPIGALTIIPNALLAKDLRFTSLAMRDLAGEVAFSGACLGLVIAGYGALGVAVALVFQRLVRWFFASLAVDWRAQIELKRSAIVRLWRFSSSQLASLTLTQVFNNIDKLLLAGFLSPTMLGFYAQGQQLTAAPVQSLTGVVNNVIFASFAKIQNDLESLKILFIKLSKGYFWASFALVAIAFPALNLIPIVYGKDWTQALMVARFLCLCIPIFSASLLEGLMLTIGGVNRRVLSTMLKLATMVALFLIIALLAPQFLSPISLAVCLVLASLVGVVINASFVIRRLELNRSDAKNLAPHAVLAASLALASVLVTSFF